MLKTLCLSVVLLAFGWVSGIYACECEIPPQVKAFRSSESVFVGRVLKSGPDGVQFRVLRSWKGVRKSQIVTLAAFDLGGCDRDIEWTSEKDYLIYASPNDLFKNTAQMIRVDCGRSAPLNNKDWNKIWQGPADDIKKMRSIAKQFRH